MKTLLVIHTAHRLDGGKMVEDISAELYDDEGMIRTIHILNIRIAGRTTICHSDTRILSRETGNYLPGCRRKDITYKEAASTLEEWKALPVVDVYSRSQGLLKSETRYLGVEYLKTLI